MPKAKDNIREGKVTGEETKDNNESGVDTCEETKNNSELEETWEETKNEDEEPETPDESDGEATAKKQKVMSEQEKKALAEKRAKQQEHITHCLHVLKTLTTTKGALLWGRKEFKEIRECLAVIKLHPESYPPLVGDKLPDGELATTSDGKPPALTPNFVSAIASYEEPDLEDEDDGSPPVLQVVSGEMDFEESSRQKKTNSVHFTHLRLCDGSNDVMTGRLAMHLAHDGNKLQTGDIIQLHLHTPITYTPSSPEKPHRSPAVVIHTYSKVGYAALPKKLNSPMHCISMTAERMEQIAINSFSCEGAGAGEKPGYERLVEVDCKPEHRYCSKYGVSTIRCLCETDPVHKVDLEMVRQYCYFATTTLEKMDNGWKRNMLYWWYMTNTYNICGKGHRQEPPDCLKAAIRKAYPSDDGWYKIYQPGK